MKISLKGVFVSFGMTFLATLLLVVPLSLFAPQLLRNLFVIFAIGAALSIMSGAILAKFSEQDAFLPSAIIVTALFSLLGYSCPVLLAAAEFVGMLSLMYVGRYLRNR